MTERTCEKCKRTLEPVYIAKTLSVDIGVRYADNLWAVVGTADDMTRAWACRNTCGDPVPVDDTPEAMEEWLEANDAAVKRLNGRPERGVIDDDPNLVKSVMGSLDRLRAAAKGYCKLG
jgi:hypothetical protein